MSGPYRKQELQALFQASLRFEGPVQRAPAEIQSASLAPLTKAVVGLILREGAEGLEFLLCRRSATVRQHAAQVCLPGGIVEEGETPLAALDREVQEETGLPYGGVEWIADPWDSVVSIFGIEAFPHLGFLKNELRDQAVYLQKEELDDSEWLPLSTLFDRKFWSEELTERGVRHDSAQRMRERLPVWCGWRHRTWGLTAILLALFVRRISGAAPY